MSSTLQRVSPILSSTKELVFSASSPFHPMLGKWVVRLAQKGLLEPKKVFRPTSRFVKAYISTIPDNTEKQSLYWKFFGPAYLESSMGSLPTEGEKVGPYLQALVNLIESKNLSSCFELGCGFFRNLIFLRSRFPELRLGGIDFSSDCDKVYEKEGLEGKKISFLHESVLDLPKFRESHALDEYELFFTFGLFCYLPYEDCKKILSDIHGYQKAANLILTEPAMPYVASDMEFKGNIDKLERSIDRGDTFIHNYFRLFEESGWRVTKSEYYNNFGGVFLEAEKA